MPLNAEAKSGIAQLATTAIIALTAHGAAVRIGRQKFWKNFAADTDNDPSTPPVIVHKALLVALSATILVAIGSITALVVTLILEETS